ncbi:hypothetical protein ACP4OV_017995 [Aristida adscensionis]
MGVTYQRLQHSPGTGRPRGGGGGGGGGVRARAWALLRWAALRLGRAARRRWCARARRLAWAGLCGERRGRRSGSAAAAAAATAGYDSASYARNFDDGEWKAEEGVRWGDVGGGGAFVVPVSASASAAVDTGGSASISRCTS